MRTFIAIATFELRYQLKSPVFIASFVVFFLLTFGGVTVDDIQIGSSNAVNINSPFATSRIVLILSLFALFIPTAMLANGVLRDVDLKTGPLFYATPVQPRVLLLGRFTGGFLASALAFASVPLAAYVGAFMPWLDPELLGETRFLQYLHIFLLFGVTNLLLSGLLLFTVANLTRSSLATYVTLIAFLMLYFTGTALLQEPKYRDLISLVDPLAINTFGNITRYWTPIERNTVVAALEGPLLWNRALWLGASGLLLGINVLFFRFRSASRSGSRKPPETNEAPSWTPRRYIAVADPEFSWRTSLAQLRARTSFEVRSIFGSTGFWILLAMGLLNSMAGILFARSWYGLSSYPVTRLLIDTVEGTFSIIPLTVAIYYGGELIWRDHNIRASEIVEATPVPSWVFYVSKLIGLTFVLLGLMTVCGLAAITVQLLKGSVEVELSQYLIRLYWVQGMGLILFGVLSLFVQVLTGNRWLGMLVMVVFIVAGLVLSNVGFEHRLYNYPDAPRLEYSDMNGYGHFLQIIGIFYAYHGCIALFLVVLSFGLWNRGQVRSLWQRLQVLPARLGVPGLALGASSVAGAVILGVLIFYNTNIVNTYRTQDDCEDRSVDYEQKYKRYEFLIQPKVIGVEAEVDIFPEERSYMVEGKYILENRSSGPIREVRVDYPYDLEVKYHRLEGAQLLKRDAEHSHYLFALKPEMVPGERRDFVFQTEQRTRGFRNDDNVSTVGYNGTFIHNVQAMPQLGFNEAKLLTDRPERRKRGLKELPRTAKIDDVRFHNRGLLKSDSDWVTFTTTVSTSADQIAIAPGYLDREWTEGDRRYFLYRMDTPIQNFFSYLSAEYEVREDTWKDVKLQVFYHADHEYNVDRMIYGMKQALDYGSSAFSPFQYRQMRIFEFPRYIGRFAQSFPNSVPYSEAIGFILDIRDSDKIDAIYYVTAHEVAHQWFGHQLSAAPTQGSSMLIETFAQYMALMVMEKEYGQDHMRRFLKYELDTYLTGRGAEIIEELPLSLVENQPYIHYQKGSLVMYALRDYLGEETVNRAISRLIDEHGYRYDPYPRSTDFLRILREEAQEQHQDLITDLFERIILFDLKMNDASARMRPNGTWDVELELSARKLEADGQGREREVKMDLPVDVGIFSRRLDGPMEAGSDHVLKLDKVRITEGEHRLRFNVPHKPLVVGIDPYNKLIDRNSDDNISEVDVQAAPSG